MKVSELIEALKTCDQNMQVVGCADEFQSYHPIKLPQIVKLVKGNMLASEDGTHWIEYNDHLYTGDDDVPAKITEETEAIRIW